MPATVVGPFFSAALSFPSKSFRSPFRSQNSMESSVSGSDAFDSIQRPASSSTAASTSAFGSPFDCSRNRASSNFV
ncbi:hypothetical protein GA0115255_113148 [Streptomyces sp. Ncost-T6T-2b]|nr:hypothetical protein GA0115255_113148 [Streptomyces sp. Ncost-T6T-2b]